MAVEVERGSGDNRHRPEGRSHVTVLGTPLKAPAVAAIAGRIADTGANIDRIERMARYPITAIDLHVSGVDPDKLRDILAREAAEQGVDIAVQAANLLRRGMRLIVMDVDSTLIQGEVIEMLAASRRLSRPRWRAMTEQAMRGEVDFAQSLRDRVALLEGLDESALDKVYDDLVLAPGCPDHGARAPSARVPLRRGQRRVHPADRPARGGSRHRLRDRQRARDRRRQADRPAGRSVVDRAGKADALRDVRRAERAARAVDDRDRRRCQRPRHAQRRRPRHRLQRQAGRPGGRPTPRSTSPTWTRSSTCSGSAARRSSPPTPRTGVTTPEPPV